MSVAQAGPMNQLIDLAAAPPPPTGTERGTVLYLWWALQFLVVAAAVYGVTRYLRRRSKNRLRTKDEG